VSEAAVSKPLENVRNLVRDMKRRLRRQRGHCRVSGHQEGSWRIRRRKSEIAKSPLKVDFGTWYL
jgi:hypothetical protein